jgi:uncharacterized protein YbaP (TraB family)
MSFGQTSIWEIKGNGNTLYLGGSVHILRASDYPLPVEFDSAYNKAATIVFETDISKLEDPAIAQSMLSKGMYHDERTLKSVLDTKVYEDLAKACKEANIPIENLSKFKPSVVVLLLTVTKIKSLGISEEGVDKHFFTKAVADGKKTFGLESVETQIDLLTSMGDGNENALVKHSLKEFHKMEKQLTSLISSWKKGDSKLMVKELEEMKKEYPTLYTAMLVNRNNAWMPQIEVFLTDKTVEFIIVGSLHLHGQDGLLALLKAKGYTVKQMEI